MKPNLSFEASNRSAPNETSESSNALKELAHRLNRLSYSDMKKFAEKLNDALEVEGISTADAILQAAVAIA